MTTPDPVPAAPTGTGKRVLVALSGGVDSAVAAWRLCQKGYEVSTAYLRSWMDEPGEALFADCPWEEDIRYASAVAAHLGVPFRVIDVIAEYRSKVVDYLVEGYRRGLTPNPDMMCNREMKFGLLRDIATSEGFDAIATGHYCRRLVDADGWVNVATGLDANKDQSYFLALVRGDQLQNALFPIGDLEKPTVRALAQTHGLPNAARKDSQGICFLGKVDINRFLARFIPDQPGPIIHAVDGRELGQHPGLHHFTLGQRKGLGIPSNHDFEHYVVVAKDFTTNTLRVAFDRPEAPGLFTQRLPLDPPNWQSRTPPSVIAKTGPAVATGTDAATLVPSEAPYPLLAKVRYRDPMTPTRLTTAADHLWVEFAEPQRALAPGQVIAFYDQHHRLLGGATYAAAGFR